MRENAVLSFKGQDAALKQRFEHEPLGRTLITWQEHKADALKARDSLAWHEVKC